MKHLTLYITLLSTTFTLAGIASTDLHDQSRTKAIDAIRETIARPAASHKTIARPAKTISVFTDSSKAIKVWEIETPSSCHIDKKMNKRELQREMDLCGATEVGTVEDTRRKSPPRPALGTVTPGSVVVGFGEHGAATCTTTSDTTNVTFSTGGKSEILRSVTGGHFSGGHTLECKVN